MKISNRKFKRQVKEAWKGMLPETHSFPTLPLRENPVPQRRHWLNVSSFMLFCFLYAVLLFPSERPHGAFDMKQLEREKIVSYFSRIQLPEDF